MSSLPHVFSWCFHARPCSCPASSPYGVPATCALGCVSTGALPRALPALPITPTSITHTYAPLNHMPTSITHTHAPLNHIPTSITCPPPTTAPRAATRSCTTRCSSPTPAVLAWARSVWRACARTRCWPPTLRACALRRSSVLPTRTSAQGRSQVGAVVPGPPHRTPSDKHAFGWHTMYVCIRTGLRLATIGAPSTHHCRVCSAGLHCALLGVVGSLQDASLDSVTVLEVLAVWGHKSLGGHHLLQAVSPHTWCREGDT